jgi:hypothetical protein
MCLNILLLVVLSFSISIKMDCYPLTFHLHQHSVHTNSKTSKAVRRKAGLTQIPTQSSCSFSGCSQANLWGYGSSVIFSEVFFKKKYNWYSLDFCCQNIATKQLINCCWKQMFYTVYNHRLELYWGKEGGKLFLYKVENMHNVTPSKNVNCLISNFLCLYV